MERRRRGKKSRVARLDAAAELNLPQPGMVTLVLLLIVTTPSPAPAGGVRVPRDSSIVIHHRIDQPSGFAPPAPERAPSTHACTTHVFPDPGYRPLWVPGSSCWNGAQSVWLPGHWIWVGPEWPLRAPGFSTSNPRPAIPLAP